MKKQLTKLLAASLLTLPASTLMAAPFGNKVDTDYAMKLWDTMEQSRLVGKMATISFPYKGVFPHGDYLDTLDGKLKVLVVEGEPRWEFRYLFNALRRDRRVDARVLLRVPELPRLASGDSKIGRAACRGRGRVSAGAGAGKKNSSYVSRNAH